MPICMYVYTHMYVYTYIYSHSWRYHVDKIKKSQLVSTGEGMRVKVYICM